jgi:hypothetical protein
MRIGSLVLGPRTRLGGELLPLLPGSVGDRLLVARDPAEASVLAGQWPGAVVAPAWEPGWAWPIGFERVAVHVCALGPIHPGAIEWDAHARAIDRDLGVVTRALAAYARCPVHVLFVSSALALAPPRAARRAYAGFKSMIEGELARLVERHGRGTLSVVYPGRLLETRSIRRPASLLHTSFARLARTMCGIAAQDRPRRSMVGPDARLLGLATSAAAAIRALLPC